MGVNSNMLSALRKKQIRKRRSSKVLTYIKKFISAVNKQNLEEASKLFVIAQSNIMKAAAKNIFKQNNAARKVSSLYKKLLSINNASK
ncbi:30S ribosomal protein S20 [Rickettsia endosymbiont of Cardiosporidium cionae]|uniref:30S ribosomal protein S20 n=1 Tax=Rickettsia endosymbiont of Cardiosporidium cionae TaxID=2777155 RepID=UPI001894D5AA|nr:30S ribosomal protein S20 [Rickettsia endosymbiont of Cardiosporidium cionae]KAF8818177.1 30S ribosomal protein S20 [Rickettsia endosymbiont of Cardiosporidium cionae]